MASAEIKPLYVLFGSDAFLIDEHRRSLLALITEGGDPQMAVTGFDATAELAEVLDELRTMPFLSPRRAVIVSDADAFVSEHREALEKYLLAPSQASSLILIVSSWPKTTRLYKLVQKIGEAIECNAGNDRAVLNWISRSAAKRGKGIAHEAAELLLRLRGADLAGLDGELEKLSLYAGSRKSISAEDVSALASATAGPAAFALTNAIAAADAPAALEALSAALTRRGEEFKVLGLIAWHLRRALAVSQQVAAGGRPALPMPPRQRAVFMEMVRRRPAVVLQGDFRRLLAADLALKTGADPTAALQELLVGLCQ